MMPRGTKWDNAQRAKDPNFDAKRRHAAKQSRELAKRVEEQRQEDEKQKLAALQHVLDVRKLQRAVLLEEMSEAMAAQKSDGLNESASPPAGFRSPIAAPSISTASPSPSHPRARSTPRLVLQSRVDQLSKELDQAASDVVRLKQELKERQQRADQAEASKISRAGEVSLTASHLLQSLDRLQQMQAHAEAETLRADKAEAEIREAETKRDEARAKTEELSAQLAEANAAMAQRPASPRRGPMPRHRAAPLRDTEAQAQLSQCQAELAQEREAKEEAQEQLASRQQQLDAVSKAKQELRDDLTREQDGSRKLKSANAEFLSANAKFLSEEARAAKSIERLRVERDRLREECNELKQARAPAVPPLRENNGQHA